MSQGAENTSRKDFLPEEFVALGRTFKAIEEKAAKERQADAGRQQGGDRRSAAAKERLGESFAKPKRDNSKRTASIVASAAGISDRTFEKAEAVVAAAEAEPEKFRPLVDEMNRTGKVNGAFKKLKVAKQTEAIAAEPPPLPTGRESSWCRSWQAWLSVPRRRPYSEHQRKSPGRLVAGARAKISMASE